MLLPTATHDIGAGVDAVLDGLDGLLVAGGSDVDPGFYGAAREAHTGPARIDRDRWEISLVRAALAQQLPTLGVCRGMQVLNVALGGDLVQHLPDAVGSDVHCSAVGVHGRHRIRMAEGGLLASAIGVHAEVASYHHQAVRRLGADLIATGWADDGTIEAVEMSGGGWVAGVQWHPEVHAGARLFTEFVAVCAGYRERTPSAGIR
jgi:putative glutamine amidotransferase